MRITGSTCLLMNRAPLEVGSTPRLCHYIPQAHSTESTLTERLVSRSVMRASFMCTYAAVSGGVTFPTSGPATPATGTGIPSTSPSAWPGPITTVYRFRDGSVTGDISFSRFQIVTRSLVGHNKLGPQVSQPGSACSRT